ncbi:unnamed protein product [Vitrella brassicaformis CCMP3155]|uniref:Uncharacterized protein n=1 Tax=Vitrella brassicaformis (strain CCMP3155) TaxID=1169540 RepID=A0A0G4FKE5_VITBC|nr:unnamed protein product [Vitrella brassicaformis CCMP3155]|eukprot:CEM14040.1 unnamed protein product [Vitrella brassicaformis CCMP3155]
MRSSVLSGSPAVMWLPFPRGWCRCAASGAGLLRPNTAPTLTSGNDTAAGAEKRRLHPGNVVCVCSKAQFEDEEDKCETNGIPTIIEGRGQSQIGVIQSLPDGTANAAPGVIAVAEFLGGVVGETSPSPVTEVRVDIPTGSPLTTGSVSINGETITTVVVPRRAFDTYHVDIMVEFNEGGTGRYATAKCVLRYVSCFEDEDCFESFQPRCKQQDTVLDNRCVQCLDDSDCDYNPNAVCDADFCEVIRL